MADLTIKLWNMIIRLLDLNVANTKLTFVGTEIRYEVNNSHLNSLCSDTDITVSSL